MSSSDTGAPRKGRPFLSLAVLLGLAAVLGVTVGVLSATPARTPEPTPAVAAVPTSTLDLRTAPPPQTLTPTQRPTPTAAPTVQVPAMAAPVSVVVTPRPTPTPEPRGRAVVFYAAPGKDPLAAPMSGPLGGTSESDHVFYRLLALRQQRDAPAGYVNPFAALRAQLAETTVQTKGTVVVGFSVPSSGEWGVSADEARLLLQQIVFTATEEAGIDRVVLTQNGGKPAVIAGKTYDAPLGRAEVR